MSARDELAKALLREVVGRVLMNHEQRSGSCKCGAGIGDSIDWKWHIANQTAIASAAHVADSHRWFSVAQADDIQCDAWDEGYDARGVDIANEGLTEAVLTPNPYRSETP